MNYFMYWAIFEFLLISVKSQDVPDVTIIFQKQNYKNMYDMTCVVGESDIDSAIAWNEPNPPSEYCYSGRTDRHYLVWADGLYSGRTDRRYSVSDYIPPRDSRYGCKISDNKDYCDNLWAGVETWKIRDSITTFLKPVTDKRWEDFTVFCSFNDTRYFISLNAASYKIHISVRTNQANIYLCGGRNEKRIRCLKILLDKTSLLTECMITRSLSGNYSEIGCNREKDKYTSNDPVVSEDEWNHFTIERTSNKLTVWKIDDDNPILSYSDTPKFYVPYVYVGNYNGVVYWKLHKYEYTATTEESSTFLGEQMYTLDGNLCLAMYVSMCEECNLKFELVEEDDEREVVESTLIIPQEALLWKTAKIMTSKAPIETSLRLRVITWCVGVCNSTYWAIDEVETCSRNEIRALSIQSETNNTSCQLIKYRHQKIAPTAVQNIQLSERACPLHTFGRNCTECSVLDTKKPNCDKSILCNIQGNSQTSVCRCASGYTPPDCIERCSPGKYGINCQEDCGHCEFALCNAMTGQCLGGKCLSPFTGPLCKTVLLPTLLVPPEIIEVTNVSCILQIKNSSYMGLEKPVSYKIEYKEDEETMWSETEYYPFTYLEPVQLQNLKSLTTYTLQAVLLTENGEGYTGRQVPKVKITTVCNEPSDASETSFIDKISVESTKARIILPTLMCFSNKNMSNYDIFWKCSNEWCVEQLLTQYISSTEQPIVIDNLFPYSDYTLEIRRRDYNGTTGFNNAVIQTFQTKPSVPNVITNLIVYSKTENSISFRVTPPYPPTGVLQQYLVEYCSGSTIFGQTCKSADFEPKNCTLWPHLHCMTLVGLENDVTYRIWVSAKNRNTTFNMPTTVTAHTTIDAPGGVNYLTFQWDDLYNLTLTWNHPTIANGPLKSFIVRISSENNTCDQLTFAINETSYKNTYTYVIPIRKCYCSRLNVTVVAVNDASESLPTTLNILSPPIVASFVEEPTVKNISFNNITLELPEITDFDGNSVMYVLISNTDFYPKTVTNIDAIPNIKHKLGFSNQPFSWIVAEFDTKPIAKQQFVVGDNTKSWSNRLKRELNNAPLHRNTDYIISLVFINQYENLRRYRIYRIEVSTLLETKASLSYYLFFALIPVLLFLIVFCFILRKMKLKYRTSFSRLLSHSQTGVNRTVNEIPLANQENLLARYSNNISSGNNGQLYSKPIKVNDFQRYVKASIKNGELERQYQLFPRGQTKPWDCGSLPQNKLKNRYNNIIAYDHTRVKLKKISRDPYSDYINANYIEGYSPKKTISRDPKNVIVGDPAEPEYCCIDEDYIQDCNTKDSTSRHTSEDTEYCYIDVTSIEGCNGKRVYIATQSPKIATVNDFWRMIWQENVKHIINLEYAKCGEKKTEQYWPNVGEYIECGDIRIRYVTTKIFADYEYRTFLITHNNEQRQVEQLHYMSWPDNGVPLYIQSLATFVKKILAIPRGVHPIVIHCSDGVGSTGTTILCDLSLKMAAAEGTIDVLQLLHNLREQRVNLVSNLEQYKLVHLVLLEYLFSHNVKIVCDEKAESTILQLLESNSIKEQFRYVNKSAWPNQVLRTSVDFTTKPEWSRKDRFQNIVPSGYGQVYLSKFPANDVYSDYINAVTVDGYRCSQQFIVTQQPLKHTICDFWRMIDEYGVTTIVSLNRINIRDESSCIFWPTEKTIKMSPTPYLTIEFENELQKNYFCIINVSLLNTKTNSKRTLNFLTLKRWFASYSLPDSEQCLLMLWEETKNLGRSSNPIVITCHDGAKASGLFVALSFVIEMIKFEQECDVRLAVQTVRLNRKQFVTEMEQFIFLYRAAIAFLRSFDLYSNFNSLTRR